MKKKILHAQKLELHKSVVSTLSPNSLDLIKGGGDIVDGFIVNGNVVIDDKTKDTKGGTFTSGKDCDGQSTIKCRNQVHGGLDPLV